LPRWPATAEGRHRNEAAARTREELSLALESGRETAFADQYMCMTRRFDVGSDGYDWLTEKLFVARGRLAGPKRIEYEVYRIVSPEAALTPKSRIAAASGPGVSSCGTCPVSGSIRNSAPGMAVA
jgi:hypothetical protein